MGTGRRVLVAAAGLAEVFEHFMGAQRGVAFLMAFAVLSLPLIVCGLAAGAKGGQGRTADEVRQMYAARQAGKNSNGRI